MLQLITLGRLRLTRDGSPRESVHVQPKRLALLAYLALAARDGFLPRDTLLALFWPHSDEHRARRCLRQAVFHLRNALGDGVIVGSGEAIGLARTGLWCDAVELEEALVRGRRREALELYAGEFLPGFFSDAGSAELEEWIETTRGRLRNRVAAAAWELVDDSLMQGRGDEALETARRARSLAPDDEQGLRHHMAVLARIGDRAAALATYADYSKRLRREFGAEPSRKSRELARTLQQGEESEDAVDVEPADSPTPGDGRPDAGSGERRRRRRAGQLVLLLVLFMVGFAVHARSPRRPAWTGGHLVLAEFTNHTRDSLLAGAVTEALRADLSRIAEVRLGPAQTGPSTDTALAIVTGDIAALGPGYTVSAQLLSGRNGRVLAAFREDAADSNYLLRTIHRLSRRLQADISNSVFGATALRR